jgi:hypothetical protein
MSAPAKLPEPAKRKRTPARPVERLALRPREAAYALSISERSIWNLISSGQLEVSRVGGVTLVPVASIHALLAATKCRP